MKSVSLGPAGHRAPHCDAERAEKVANNEGLARFLRRSSISVNEHGPWPSRHARAPSERGASSFAAVEAMVALMSDVPEAPFP